MDSKAREHRYWLRFAGIEALVGAAVALLVAITLNLITHWTGFGDMDHDFGLRVQLWFREHWTQRSSAIALAPNEPGFVFLDIDEEDVRRAGVGGASSANVPFELAACQALAKASGGHYALASTSTQTKAAPPAPGDPLALDCLSARPANRALIGELINGLQTRNPGPRLIVVDVNLAEERGAVPEKELNILRAALNGTKVPVVFAAAVKHLTIDRTDPLGRYVQLEPSSRSFERLPVVEGGIALPEGGEPLRRYPKCYRDDDEHDRLIPSLPFLAASMLRGDDNPRGPCRAVGERAETSEETAPRIDFVVPSLGQLHVDENTSVAALSEREFAVRTIYRALYQRCLAAAFWSAGTACGDAATYADKVVVIGASNPLRRDLHATPLGTMVGAEVVINAIHTFASPTAEEPAGWVTWMGKTIKQILVCSLIWFVFFAVRGALSRNDHLKPPAFFPRMVRGGMVLFLFTLTLLVVLFLTIKEEFPSLSILGGVVAIAAELYVEQISKAMRWLQESLEHWLIPTTVGLLLLVPRTLAQAAPAECDGGAFARRAMVAEIDPSGETLRKRRTDGTEQPVQKNGYICAGEAIVLPIGGRIRHVYLYMGGRRETVEPGKPFQNTGGATGFIKDALTFVTQVLAGNKDGGEPFIPTATATRGGRPSDPAMARHLRVMDALRELPRQRMTAGVHPVLGWRDGVGPYVCAEKDGNGDVAWQAPTAADSSWCAFGADVSRAALILVTDARAERHRWNVDVVPWAAVPRPAWIPRDVTRASGADRTAWALWLWKHAAADWRLQALAMLNDLAQTEWLAGYLRDGILAELPVLTPQTGVQP